MKYTRVSNGGGFALLLSIIISSVVLAIGVSILHISVNQINLSATARESELAFQSAQAGIDCMWYWRNEKISEYLARTTADRTNPAIDCFGTNRTFSFYTEIPEDSGTRHIKAFLEMFQWGTPERCTEIAMYIMDARVGADMELGFINKGIGSNGIKICEAGSICTVLVSDGYNRACDELDSSIFSVQREIVVEF